ncbi:hypothetical protein [Streptomyces sp. NPDC017941]|uniref:hypothetical protein n=1 Tax=unclassified Streptomyces TaxID=2593676 RepID=UPI0037985BEB
MSNTRRTAAVLVATAAALGSLAAPSHAASDAPASDRGPRACYDHASPYQGYPGTGPDDPAYWPARGVYSTVLGYCDDINIKTNYTRDVRVCRPGVCHGWQRAVKGQWTVIFKNTTPGAKYYLQFKGVNASSGWIAD